MLALNEALDALEHCNPRQARVVHLRFFAGLTIDEVAEALELSPRTVRGDWTLARLWLFERLTEGLDGERRPDE